MANGCTAVTIGAVPAGFRACGYAYAMIIAVEPMDATVKMIVFAVAVVLFGLAAVGYSRGKVSFLAAGLAAFAFPFFWDALAAS